MKKFLTIAFCSLFLAGQAQNLEDGMVLYYPMNGNCLDSSGNNFHGTSNALLTADHNGASNRAFHFNGVDQYIDWPADTLLHPQLPVSFAFWVKFDNATDEDGAIFTNDFTENKYTGVYCGLTSLGKFILSMGDGGSISPNTRRSLIGTTTADTGVWYYVIGIISGPTDMELLINCKSDEGTYDGNGGALSYTGTPGTLGRYDADNALPANYLKGSLDDFRFWNRSLTYLNIYDLCSLTEVNEFAGNEDRIRLFPNPASDKVYLMNVPDAVAQIDLYTLTGSRLLSKEEVVGSIDVSGLAMGCYFVHFLDQDGGVIWVEKFIKE